MPLKRGDDETHEEGLARVRLRLADVVLAFCRDRLARGKAEFHADDLRGWCEERVAGLAPNSPYRILYDLRRHGRLDYQLLSRRDSHYRLLRVEAGGGGDGE